MQYKGLIVSKSNNIINYLFNFEKKFQIIDQFLKNTQKVLLIFLIRQISSKFSNLLKI